jgi:glutathione S-transferase
MKLYYSKGACSLAVRIVINELHLPCQYEAVNLKTHQTEHGQDFYQVNPKGAVPALLLDDGQLLTENNVIQQYLADTQKGGEALLPKSGLARYRVLEWSNHVSTDFHKSCGPLFNPNVPDKVKKEIFIPILTQRLERLNQILNGKSYLMGEQFSLPDAYLFVVLRWLPHLGVSRDKFSFVEAYFNRLQQRPSVQKSLQEEGLV